MPISPHRVWKKSKVTDSDLDFDFLVPKVSANHMFRGHRVYTLMKKEKG